MVTMINGIKCDTTKSWPVVTIGHETLYKRNSGGHFIYSDIPIGPHAKHISMLNDNELQAWLDPLGPQKREEVLAMINTSLPNERVKSYQIGVSGETQKKLEDHRKRYHMDYQNIFETAVALFLEKYGK